MRIHLELHGYLVVDAPHLECARAGIFPDINGILPDKFLLKLARADERVARIDVGLHDLGHAAGNHVRTRVLEHHVVQVAIDRRSLSHACAHVIQKPLLDSNRPAELLEIERAHDMLLGKSHRERRDTLELRSKHRAGKRIGIPAVFDKPLDKRHDFRIFLNLIDEDEGVVLDERLRGEERDAVDEVHRVTRPDDRLPRLLIKQQVDLNIAGVGALAERPDDGALPHLARSGKQDGLMRFPLPALERLFDLSPQHTMPPCRNRKIASALFYKNWQIQFAHFCRNREIGFALFCRNRRIRPLPPQNGLE